MGQSLDTAKVNQAAAKASLAKMCEAISEAVLEVAKTGGRLNETLAAQAAEEVGKVAQQQAERSGAEIIKIIRVEQLKQALKQAGGSGGNSGGSSGNSNNSNDTATNLAANLLFLEILRVALNDEDSKSDSASSAKVTEIEIAHPWTRKHVLGKGAFGVVYCAVDKNGLEFAVKEVPREGVEEKSIREEVKVLGKLAHKNIVQFYGCSGDKEKIYMYMEIMQGSIKDIIENSGNSIPQGRAKRYTKDFLQGLIYLHENGVVHNDIKCANVLLDYSGNAKLADMGVAKKHDQETRIKYSDDEIAGTVAWISPEVMMGQESGKRSDVWSAGCTVYEMVKSKPPFVDQLPPILLHTILPGLITFFQHRNHVAKQNDLEVPLRRFLLRIFVRIEDRPFAEDIADDPWLE